MSSSQSWPSWKTGWSRSSLAEGRRAGSSSRQRRIRSLRAGETVGGTSGGPAAHAIWKNILLKYFFTKIFFVEIFLSKILPYPEYKREMIGNIRCSPWRFACDHLNDAAAEGPDITGPAVAVSSENLRRHEGDCSLKLSLELSRHGGLWHHPGCSSKVCNTEVVARVVHQ